MRPIQVTAIGAVLSAALAASAAVTMAGATATDGQARIDSLDCPSDLRAVREYTYGAVVDESASRLPTVPETAQAVLGSRGAVLDSAVKVDDLTIEVTGEPGVVLARNQATKQVEVIIEMEWVDRFGWRPESMTRCGT